MVPFKIENTLGKPWIILRGKKPKKKTWLCMYENLAISCIGF
jgi:hypothetical protein